MSVVVRTSHAGVCNRKRSKAGKPPEEMSLCMCVCRRLIKIFFFICTTIDVWFFANARSVGTAWPWFVPRGITRSVTWPVAFASSAMSPSPPLTPLKDTGCNGETSSFLWRFSSRWETVERVIAGLGISKRKPLA